MTSPRGGQRSPADPLLREAARRIVAAASDAPQFLWIGYDNMLFLGLRGEHMEVVLETARLLSKAWSTHMCFKALMKIEALGEDQLRATMLVHGSDEVYALSYNKETGRSYWILVDEFDALTLRQMREW